MVLVASSHSPFDPVELCAIGICQAMSGMAVGTMTSAGNIGGSEWAAQYGHEDYSGLRWRIAQLHPNVLKSPLEAKFDSESELRERLSAS